MATGCGSNGSTTPLLGEDDLGWSLGHLDPLVHRAAERTLQKFCGWPHERISLVREVSLIARKRTADEPAKVRAALRLVDSLGIGRVLPSGILPFLDASNVNDAERWHAVVSISVDSSLTPEELWELVGLVT